MNKRNHYVPQLLLRRFASRGTKKGDCVWVFRKEEPPFETETKNAGVESFFYGDPSSGVEGSLSTVETKWAQLLEWLDSGAHPAARAAELWRLAWVLGMRTRAIRTELTATVQNLLARFASTDDTRRIAAVSRLFDSHFERFWTAHVAALPPDRAAVEASALSRKSPCVSLAA